MLGSMAAMTQPPAQPPAGGWPSPEASARWNPPHRTPHLPQPQPQQPHPQPQQLQPQSEPLQPRLQQQPFPPAATLPRRRRCPSRATRWTTLCSFQSRPCRPGVASGEGGVRVVDRVARGQRRGVGGDLVVLLPRRHPPSGRAGSRGCWGFSLAVSAGVIAWRAAKFVRAKRELAALHEGLALGVGRGGLFLADAGAHLSGRRWPASTPPRTPLAGAAAWWCAGRPVRSTPPLDHLATNPAALDGAVRAMSGGRSWIELGRLDD